MSNPADPARTIPAPNRPFQNARDELLHFLDIPPNFSTSYDISKALRLLQSHRELLEYVVVGRGSIWDIIIDNDHFQLASSIANHSVLKRCIPVDKSSPPIFFKVFGEPKMLAILVESGEVLSRTDKTCGDNLFHFYAKHALCNWRCTKKNIEYLEMMCRGHKGINYRYISNLPGVNDKNKEGKTPIDIAVLANSTEYIKILVEAFGAEIHTNIPSTLVSSECASLLEELTQKYAIDPAGANLRFVQAATGEGEKCIICFEENRELFKMPCCSGIIDIKCLRNAMAFAVCPKCSFCRVEWNSYLLSKIPRTIYREKWDPSLHADARAALASDTSVSRPTTRRGRLSNRRHEAVDGNTMDNLRSAFVMDYLRSVFGATYLTSMFEASVGGGTLGGVRVSGEEIGSSAPPAAATATPTDADEQARFLNTVWPEMIGIDFTFLRRCPTATNKIIANAFTEAVVNAKHACGTRFATGQSGNGTRYRDVFPTLNDIISYLDTDTSNSQNIESSTSAVRIFGKYLGVIPGTERQIHSSYATVEPDDNNAVFLNVHRKFAGECSVRNQLKMTRIITPFMKRMRCIMNLNVHAENVKGIIEAFLELKAANKRVLCSSSSLHLLNATASAISNIGVFYPDSLESVYSLIRFFLCLVVVERAQNDRLVSLTHYIINTEHSVNMTILMNNGPEEVDDMAFVCPSRRKSVSNWLRCREDNIATRSTIDSIRNTIVRYAANIDCCRGATAALLELIQHECYID